MNDHDLHKDLTTLGMIKDVKIDGNNVAAIVELTTPACPLKIKLKKIALMQLKRNSGSGINNNYECKKFTK